MGGREVEIFLSGLAASTQGSSVWSIGQYCGRALIRGADVEPRA